MLKRPEDPIRAPNPFDLLLDQFRMVVREELREALKESISPQSDADTIPKTEWMRAEDLARIYKLPKSLFDEQARAGKIKRTRPGRHFLINVPDFERFLQSLETGGALTEQTSKLKKRLP